MVLTRLNYGSGTLAGLLRHLMDRLQSVINAAARSAFSARKYDHITPLLRELHWLSYLERIAYRRAVLAFRCQHSLAPSYLSVEIHRVSDVDCRRRLRSASTAVLVVPRSKHSTIGDRAFQLPRRMYGTPCWSTSHLRRHCRPSNGDWKLKILNAAIHPSMSNVHSCSLSPGSVHSVSIWWLLVPLALMNS